MGHFHDEDGKLAGERLPGRYVEFPDDGRDEPKIPLVKTTLIVNWPKEMAQDNVPSLTLSRDGSRPKRSV